MKSTGVIRRIDDLGRIVIPKEIRRNLKIRDGENMEIFVDLDSIILKKFSKLEDVHTLADKLGNIINNLTNYNILITDRDHIISSYGKEFSDLKNELLSNELIELIDSRTILNEKNRVNIELTSKIKKEGYYYIVPIISSADSIGLIIIYNEEPLKEMVEVIAKMVSLIICEQVDIS